MSAFDRTQIQLGVGVSHRIVSYRIVSYQGRN